MSVSQMTSDQSQLDHPRCSRCDSVLPAHATFCGACGERVDKSASSLPVPDNADVAERYRITSLVCRRPYMQIFFAIDTEYQRPAVIRDIDVSGLDEEARALAIEAVQLEYDLLSRQRVPDVMPVIDLRYFHEHLFLITGWPFTIDEQEAGSASSQHPALVTLHDLLQSGEGLPDEDIAVAWIYRLCRALERLHSHHIVMGDLDPHAIAVSDGTYKGWPAFMVSWLPSALRDLLPPVSVPADASHFIAPEVYTGTVDARSDIYSLGAILYLLLTGTVPDEPEQRLQRLLRSPRELNTRVSSGLDELVMQAISLESVDRFQSAEEMCSALLKLSASTKQVRPLHPARRGERGRRARPKVMDPPADTEDSDETLQINRDDDDVTISVVPLQAQLARRRLAQQSKHPAGKAEQQTVQEEINDSTAAEETLQMRLEEELVRAEQPHELPPEHTDDEGVVQELHEPATIDASAESPEAPHDYAENGHKPEPSHDAEEGQEDHSELSMQRLKERLSGALPVLPHLIERGRNLSHLRSLARTRLTFLRQVRRFILGEQQRSTAAAALIETPLRIQPNQSYALRIRLMGRDEPVLASGARKDKDAPLAGLSGLAQGETVHIEVRSALYQNYAYIVQRVDVTIPKRGYAAEVTIPMHPLSNGSSGRRERLHIFFMDEMRCPLYEKPFVVEVFVSHLVHAGREGHSVLAIPL
jgi:serine/threonine protein kinase